MTHKSICRFRLGFLAVAGLWGALGCDSAPAKTSDPDTKAKVEEPAKPAAATPAKGPKRIEARRAPQPSTTPAPAADPTAALLNPGDEIDAPAPKPTPAAAPKGTPAAAAAQTAAAQPAASKGGKAPTAAERAAAARMAADNDRRRKAEADAAAARANPADVDAERASWSVLLATASGPDSRDTANTIRTEVARRFPTLKDAFVRSTQRGSVVLVGRYESPKDPQAQARLADVKQLVDGNVPAFPRAMLTRLGANAEQGPPGPNDLRIVRQTAPTQTLYTLQVAVWSAFGTDEIKMSEIKRSAEDYCRRLRGEGNEAYYFHDFDTKTSTVTVGVFGDGAYDPRSTLYAPEVDAVMRKFPKHLVNGEELLVPMDPRNPSSKTMPQAPRLVEIPKF
jgi:hypothetical protein